MTANVRMYTLNPAQLRAVVTNVPLNPSDPSSYETASDRAERYTVQNIIDAFRATLAMSLGGPGDRLVEQIEQGYTDGEDDESVFIHRGTRAATGRTLIIQQGQARFAPGKVPGSTEADLIVQGKADVVRDGRPVLTDATRKWRNAFGITNTGQIFLAIGHGTGAEFARELAARGARDGVLGTEGAQVVIVGNNGAIDGPGEAAPAFLFSRGNSAPVGPGHDVRGSASAPPFGMLLLLLAVGYGIYRASE